MGKNTLTSLKLCAYVTYTPSIFSFDINIPCRYNYLPSVKVITLKRKRNAALPSTSFVTCSVIELCVRPHCEQTTDTYQKFCFSWSGFWILIDWFLLYCNYLFTTSAAINLSLKHLDSKPLFQHGNKTKTFGSPWKHHTYIIEYLFHSRLCLSFSMAYF